MASQKGKEKAIPEPLEVPTQVLSRVSVEKKRTSCVNSLNDMIQLVLGLQHKKQTGEVDAEEDTISDFPTLEVGYLARAVGLNISNAQVLDIVRLVEHDLPSLGAVPQDRLRHVLVNAMMTGVIGGPTLYENGLIPASRKNIVAPSFCVREGERHIFRAFLTLDKTNQGFLYPEALREAMMGHGEQFSEEEMQEMLMAATDSDTGRIYYYRFADILAHD